ncbi:MAG: 2-phospho-L-lactate transferase [Methanospirillaceae archaeon]|nr:2-phospho-L-lactate transferase [Methanospirillaceae archaeon]
MITFLSGGTGTPKLLAGAREILGDGAITVIVNTAEDMWYQGGHLSPDIDTVLYLFAGLLNKETWWGIAGDSFVTHKALRSLGSDAYLSLGDRDRATTIIRGDYLRSGLSLTEATKMLSGVFGLSATIIPMCDTPVASMVQTETGIMHFQEYWVKHRGTCAITGIVRESDKEPCATREVISSIQDAEMVVIGPSNPVTSILPILSCAGVRQALAKKRVVAISPFIGDEPVSGPARDLMIAHGVIPDSRGVFLMYSDFLDIFIQDESDPVTVPGSVRCNTLMKNETIAADLMRRILELGEIGG